jgi:hypothetical protein
MSREAAPLETLDRKIAELASFITPSEIFRALLEGTATGAPRAAIFLLRDGRFKGWSSIGYPAAAAQAQRQMVAPADSGWLAAVAGEDDDVRWRSLAAGEAVPDFGQPHAGDTVGLPVRVGGKAVAIVLAERTRAEEPWSPAGLSILCQAARLRLELDLAWRRLRSATSPSEAPLAREAAPEPAPRRGVEPVREAAAPARGSAAAVATEIATYPAIAAEPAVADPRHEEARRFAKLVATDIRLYNEEAVIAGRRQRDLTQRLGEQLQRGREAFSQRFPDLGTDGTQLLRDAYVQILAGGDASLI